MARTRVLKVRKASRKTFRSGEREGLGFRPLGSRVLVRFEQSDWEMKNGLLVKTGLDGAGYRMDGLVVAVGPHVPEDVGVGSTVYANPREAVDVLKIGTARYHLMEFRDLMAVAVAAGKDKEEK